MIEALAEDFDSSPLPHVSNDCCHGQQWQIIYTLCAMMFLKFSPNAETRLGERDEG